MREALNLAIFDVDGTLTQTNRVDDQCFVQAFADELGLAEIDANWPRYPTVCDSGLTRHIFLERVGRFPSAEEIARLQRRFVLLLEQAHEQNPELFTGVPGAGKALKKLRQESGWGVAIATGGWQRSALFKLQKAQIDTTEIPAAFADDGITREDIIAAAVVRARSWYRQEGFRHIVYIGDGIWDGRAARQLNLAFLGVATGERETALRTEGATAIIQDFLDFDRFRQRLEELVYGKSVVCPTAEPFNRAR